MQFDKIIDVPVSASCRFPGAGCEETVELPQMQLVEKSLFPDVQVVQFPTLLRVWALHALALQFIDGVAAD